MSTETKTFNPLGLGRKMKPTLKHRPAVWEAILGTVEAMNDKGEVQYFDYDYDGAVAFAGVTPDRDPRTFRSARKQDLGSNYIRKGQIVLYVRQEM